MSDGGKGSAPRPLSVSHDTFAKQFEAIFGAKNDKRIHNRQDETELCNRDAKEQDASEANDSMGGGTPRQGD